MLIWFFWNQQENCVGERRKKNKRSHTLNQQQLYHTHTQLVHEIEREAETLQPMSLKQGSGYQTTPRVLSKPSCFQG
jgi:RNase adaptor protein for sRNA GlmZ degradation